MVRKKKNQKGGMLKYMRELSVVIVGIAITFTGSGLINRCSDRNDLKMYLNAVRLELEDNLELAAERSAYYDRSNALNTYLRSDIPQRLNTDSLRSYRDITHNYSFLTYKTSAFDMFKTSGAMRLVSNKQLLQDIWDCYSMLEQARLESDHYMQNKSDLIREKMSQKEDINVELDIRKPENRSLLIFYTSGTDQSLKELFGTCAGQIRQTLAEF